MYALHDRPRAAPHFGSGAGEPRPTHSPSRGGRILSRWAPGALGSPASGPLRSWRDGFGRGRGGSAVVAGPSSRAAARSIVVLVIRSLYSIIAVSRRDYGK